MSNTNSSSNSGISGLFLIGCIFLVLKLCHVISWSWWLVLLPFYFGVAFVVALSLSVLIGGSLIASVVVTISHFADKHAAKKRRKAFEARANKRAGR